MRTGMAVQFAFLVLEKYMVIAGRGNRLFWNLNWYHTSGARRNLVRRINDWFGCLVDTVNRRHRAVFNCQWIRARLYTGARQFGGA